MTRITGGAAIVQSLAAHGVETVFGLPGVQMDPFYHALYDARHRPAHLRHRHGPPGGRAAAGAGHGGVRRFPGVLPGRSGKQHLSGVQGRHARPYSRGARQRCSPQMQAAGTGRRRRKRNAATPSRLARPLPCGSRSP
ncbi:MAG: hypothetical protein IIA41_14310 [SAR324 cluster bacterium]|nr:hypothetical protein [SAR324 cluster bacterium]